MNTVLHNSEAVEDVFRRISVGEDILDEDHHLLACYKQASLVAGMEAVRLQKEWLNGQEKRDEMAIFISVFQAPPLMPSPATPLPRNVHIEIVYRHPNRTDVMNLSGVFDASGRMNFTWSHLSQQ